MRVQRRGAARMFVPGHREILRVNERDDAPVCPPSRAGQASAFSVRGAAPVPPKVSLHYHNELPNHVSFILYRVYVYIRTLERGVARQPGRRLDDVLV